MLPVGENPIDPLRHRPPPSPQPHFLDPKTTRRTNSSGESSHLTISATLDYVSEGFLANPCVFSLVNTNAFGPTGLFTDGETWE